MYVVKTHLIASFISVLHFGQYVLFFFFFLAHSSFFFCAYCEKLVLVFMHVGVH